MTPSPATQPTAHASERARPSRGRGEGRPPRTLPPVARRRLIAIGSGWALAALAEAGAYTVLAVAIRDGLGVWPVLTAAAVSLVATVLISRAGYLAGARLAGDLYDALGRTLARARLSWFTVEHRALVAAAAGRGIPTLMGVPAHQLQTLVLAPLVPALMVVATGLVIGWATAAALAALLAVALTAQVFAQRRLAATDAARHALEHAATGATIELVDSLELLRTAAGPTRALERAEATWGGRERAMARTTRAASLAELVSGLASAAPLAGVLLLLVASGGLADPASALALIVLTARASAPLNDLALIGISLSELRTHTASYRTVAAAPALPAPTRREAEPSGHAIELAAAALPPALSEVTASLPEGARVHVAGPSGAGKSTLLGLLLRFDDPTQGTVSLGGVPLTALSEREITERIAYVPQDPVVFTGTIAENVRLGRPQASDAEVAVAVEAAQLGAVLARDPLGIHQPVGTNGQALSGGERQRVAIARAIIAEAPVLVLDEATSALDAETERRVAAAILELGSTLVVVTHRDPAVWRPDHTVALGGHASRAA